VVLQHSKAEFIHHNIFWLTFRFTTATYKKISLLKKLLFTKLLHDIANALLKITTVSHKMSI